MILMVYKWYLIYYINGKTNSSYFIHERIDIPDLEIKKKKHINEIVDILDMKYII